MKISGFTIIKNAVLNDYPITEAILSVLPVVDEMVVLIGDSEDDTEQLIKNISDPKIKIHYSTWDRKLRKGGAVLAVETNKAFQLIDPASEWAFYIQGDEVVHEKYHSTIREAVTRFKDDKKVEGLLFKYLHFYGTYDFIGDSRRWYHREVRVIRNNKKICAYRDAQGFRVGKRKLLVKEIDAHIYHYGWVKSPTLMKQKIKNVSRFWNEDTDELEKLMRSSGAFNFDDFDSLQLFSGTHPSVMQRRIQQKNWKPDIDISQKKFGLKDKLLYWLEKKTGKRIFDFKNYKII